MTFTDDFAGTNGQELSARTGWTKAYDGLYYNDIYSNGLACRQDTGSGYTLYLCTDQGSANQYTQAIDVRFYAGLDTEAYFVFRCADVDNWIGYHHAGTGSAGGRIQKRVSAVNTDSLITWQHAAGNEYKITVDSDDLVTVYKWSGSDWTYIDEATISDGSSNTRQGFCTGVALGNDRKWDDFEAGLLAAGGYTLTAGTGAFTLTGIASGLKADRNIAAAVGSFNLTGQAAGILKGYNLAPEVGAFALTGQAAGILRGYRIASEPGAFTLTGQAAGLLADRTIPAGTGVFVLTGQAADLRYGFHLIAETGAFTLTGQTAGLLADRTIPAGTGAFVLTGQAAALLRDAVLAAGTGAFVLTGQAAGLLRDAILAAGTGAFVVTGKDAALTYSGVVVFYLPDFPWGFAMLVSSKREAELALEYIEELASVKRIVGDVR